MMNFKLQAPIEPLRIGIDIDGVIADFIPAYIKRLNKMSGLKNPECNEGWDSWHCEDKLGYDKEIVKAFWRDVANPNKDDFWYTLEPIDEVEPLTRDHDITFITTRPLASRWATIDWAEQNHNILHPQVIVTEKKGQVADALKLHAMFDDKPDNLLDVMRHCGMTCMPFLIDRPWNKSCEHSYIIRVETIAAGMAILKQEMDKIANG